MYLADPDAFCSEYPVAEDTPPYNTSAAELNHDLLGSSKGNTTRTKEPCPVVLEVSWDLISTNGNLSKTSREHIGTSLSMNIVPVSSISDQESELLQVKAGGTDNVQEVSGDSATDVSYSSLRQLTQGQPIVEQLPPASDELCVPDGICTFPDAIKYQGDIRKAVSTVTEPPIYTIQIPKNSFIQSIDMIQAAYGSVRKIVVVRPSTVQMQQPSISAATPPKPNTTLREKQKDKPSLTYIALIGKALLSTPSVQMDINSIYNYIIENYSFYRTTTLSWRNSIRHNLSVNDCFVKAGKMGSGRCFLWGIHHGLSSGLQSG